MILAADFEKIDFRAELKAGHLALEGILADQSKIDNIPVGIYVLEKDGTLVRCNKTAIAAWGRTPPWGPRKSIAALMFFAIHPVKLCLTNMPRRRW